MFLAALWDALWRLLLVMFLLSLGVSFIWLSIYRYCGFFLPHAVTGMLARGVIWARHARPTTILQVTVIAAVLISVPVWSFLWPWTLSEGAVILVATRMSGAMKNTW